MCKYYAHHLTCYEEKKKRGCEYLHDINIRAAHDTIKLNIAFGQETPVDETRQKLVYNYDDSNPKHRKLVMWKEEVLSKYPEKPTLREKMRGNNKEYSRMMQRWKDETVNLMDTEKNDD